MAEFLTSIGFLLQTWAQTQHENTAHSASANIFVEPISLEVNITKEEEKQKKTCEIQVFRDFYGKEKNIITSATKKLPCELLQGLQNIAIYTNHKRPRAMSSATKLYMRDDFFELPESEKVLVHELAHIMDLSGLRSKKYKSASNFIDGNATIFNDDASVEFYEISWINNKTWKKETTEKDFITGYAATDPFEDFAESVVMYVYNGNTFRALAKKFPSLQKKYDFLKKEIFQEKEFIGGSIPTNLEERKWDSTKI